jgi:hypothetical protein
MKRSQLEHLIRACTQIADDDELVIIGSQRERYGVVLGNVRNQPPPR